MRCVIPCPFLFSPNNLLVVRFKGQIQTTYSTRAIRTPMGSFIFKALRSRPLLSTLFWRSITTATTTQVFWAYPKWVSLLNSTDRICSKTVSLQPGYRKVKFVIPYKYITDSMTPNKTMDIGVINLEVGFRDEERKFLVDWIACVVFVLRLCVLLSGNIPADWRWCRFR